MQGVDPKWVFYLGLLVTIETAIGQGTISLTNVIPDLWAPFVKSWCTLLSFIGTAIMTALSGYSSKAAGPLTSVPTGPAAKMITWLAIPLALAVLLAQPADAWAQAKPPVGQARAPLSQVLPGPNGPIHQGLEAIEQKHDASVASGNAIKLTGDPIADIHAAIQKGGDKLILHLKQSYALAMATTGTGSADNTSAMCTKALVPIAELVIRGPKAGTLPDNDPMALTPAEVTMAADTGEGEGIIVRVEKLRILRLVLNSPALNDACGALVQDEVKNAQSLVGKLTSLITGAGLVGIGVPGLP